MQHARPDYQKFIIDTRTVEGEPGGIPSKEPVMLFRGQDCLAPAVLRFYAFKLSQIGARAEMIQQVQDQADAMDAWPVKKTPDAP